MTGRLVLLSLFLHPLGLLLRFALRPLLFYDTVLFMGELIKIEKKTQILVFTKAQEKSIKKQKKLNVGKNDLLCVSYSK